MAKAANRSFAAALLLLYCVVASGAAPPPAVAAETAIRASARPRQAPVRLPPAWLYMLNAKQGWGVDGNAILKTTNGGATWVDVTPAKFPRDMAFEGGAFLSASTGWVAYAWTCIEAYCPSGSGVGGVLQTKDGGRTWRATAIGSPSGQMIVTTSIDFVNSRDGWLMAGYGGAAGNEAVDIYRTTDGGAAWRRVSVASFTTHPPAGSLPVGGDKHGIVFSNARHGWVTGYTPANNGFDYVYETTDGGRTWRHRSLPSPPGLDLSHAQPQVSVPSFFDGRYGVLVDVVQAAIVYTTTDGGAAWRPTAVKPDLLLSDIQFVSTKVGWAMDARRHIVRTVDGGVTWTAVAVPAAASGASYLLVSRRIVFLWKPRMPEIWTSVNGGTSWHLARMTLKVVA